MNEDVKTELSFVPLTSPTADLLEVHERLVEDCGAELQKSDGAFAILVKR